MTGRTAKEPSLIGRQRNLAFVAAFLYFWAVAGASRSQRRPRTARVGST
jgi:hypothetical protein